MVARADIASLTPFSAPSTSRGPTIATTGALVAGLIVAAGLLTAPAVLVETLVVRSGIVTPVDAAVPPLGLTAPTLLATGGGVLVLVVTWAVLVLVAGDRRLSAIVASLRRSNLASDGPSVRRADSHPDAPPRSPILAERELGAPFMSIVARAEPYEEHALRADLDTALAAIDPTAISDTPREPMRPVAPLAIVSTPPQTSAAASPPLEPGERIASIELGADVRDRSDTIESLLARLERGAAQWTRGTRETASA